MKRSQIHLRLRALKASRSLFRCSFNGSFRKWAIGERRLNILLNSRTKIAIMSELEANNPSTKLPGYDTSLEVALGGWSCSQKSSSASFSLSPSMSRSPSESSLHSILKTVDSFSWAFWFLCKGENLRRSSFVGSWVSRQRRKTLWRSFWDKCLWWRCQYTSEPARKPEHTGWNYPFQIEGIRTKMWNIVWKRWKTPKGVKKQLRRIK